jgi:predicted phage terminase large subunit-like protein
MGIAKIIATGTPKISRPAAALIRRLLKQDDCFHTRMKTMDNIANLSESFFDAVVSRNKGTRLEKQELEGLLLDDVEGALWSRDLLEAIVVGQLPRDVRITQCYIGVDPSDGTETSDEQAYTVVGKGSDSKVYVLESFGEKLPPIPFLKRCVQAAIKYDARLVLEKNHGGQYLLLTLRQVMKEMKVTVAVIVVSASQGKRTRAEPVAGLYERGVVRHLHAEGKDSDGNSTVDDSMVELEDQMSTYTGATGEKSPDRLDSLVWAVTPYLNHTFETTAVRGGVRRWDIQVELDRREAEMKQWATAGARRRDRIPSLGQPEEDAWDGMPDDGLLERMDGRQGRPNVRKWK